ncbi:MAG: type I-A CRISPR-associated protein Cas4/Csa1 [Methanotrichaceae archaeon]|nr:type I-A CRISPR-associated protein Cas4/Csa1 [Methanotrichaceae archaeon]
MYFLSEEEKRLLLRKFLPQAREKGVAEELRGWNWDRPPLSPIYSVKLGIYEIAGKYCPTSRDVYLRRVAGVRPPPSPAMAEGAVLHKVLCHLIVEAKRTIYNHGVSCLEDLEEFAGAALSELWTGSRANSVEAETREKVNQLWDFEHRRIMARVQDILARQPHVGVDSLVALALPVTVEHRLDGSFLGLSQHLSADAFMLSEPMMLDVKFGKREKFHRLSTTGYALAMESLYEYPVNVGCIVYASFQGGNLRIERDFHLIDDELRQWFVEERDERMRMVEEEIDPGVAANCPEVCFCWEQCHAA